MAVLDFEIVNVKVIISSQGISVIMVNMDLWETLVEVGFFIGHSESVTSPRVSIVLVKPPRPLTCEQ